MIADQKGLEELRDYQKRSGGGNLLEAGIRRAEEGQTSLDEVIRVALFE